MRSSSQSTQVSSNRRRPSSEKAPHNEGGGEPHFDHRNEEMTPSLRTFCFCASVNAATIGYDQGTATRIWPLLAQEFGVQEHVSASIYIGLFVIFMMMGAAISPFISDRFGRRTTLGFANVVLLVGSITMGLAHNYRVLLIGRVVAGLGAGLGFMVCCCYCGYTYPSLLLSFLGVIHLLLYAFAYFSLSQVDTMYITEISPTALRGELVTCSYLASNVGLIMGVSAGLLSSSLIQEDEDRRRAIILLGTLFPVFVIVTAKCTLVESPRFLLQKKSTREATMSLSRIYPQGMSSWLLEMT